MAKAMTVTTEISGFEIGLNYNESTKRITTVEWALPRVGITAHVLIWNNELLVYDRIVSGPDSGTENIPGNHTMEWVEFAGAMRWMVPSYLTYAVFVESTVI